MSVWLTIPSKKPRAEAQKCIDAWRAQGYLVAIRRDIGDETVDCDLLQYGAYEGYAKAVNGLIRDVMKYDADAQWFIAAGDDITPDPTKRAEEIARECFDHFGGTFGCVQPTGDRWGEDPNQPNFTLRGAYIDRVCASAFIGREFCERAYGGNGPLFDGYFHMHVDEELQAVAVKLGVLWQRRDLTHKHDHWARERKPMPQYLRFVNSPQHWTESKALYESRKAAGFPGHEVLAAVAA